ncbi:hypothetical protein FRB90_002229 [Tulasnella sp. 427]|nr:hypothetical protein FRB90_002229 [Tulasnella sp. 427]
MTAAYETQSTAEVWIPSSIGGFVTSVDYIPSIILLLLFAFSLSPWIKRQFDPNTRTITLGFATTLFAMGRVLLYNLRILEARYTRPGDELNGFAMIYEQMGFAVGYMAVMIDAVAFARAVLVSATLEDVQRSSRDRPGLRNRIRWTLWYPAFMFTAMSALGVVTYILGTFYMTGQRQTRFFWSLRYVCDVTTMSTMVIFIGGLLWVRQKLNFLDTRALDSVIKLSGSLLVIPIYRICVLHYRFPHITIHPSPPYTTNSLTSANAKVVFYILHALPEVLVVYWIQCTNLRTRFNTGPYGDWYQDDTKHGIPQLREEGVIVPGVGVPPSGRPAKPTWSWWLRFLFVYERRPSRKGDIEEDGFDPDRESLLTLVRTRSDTCGESEKTWW